ncbi:hypothetical protein [Thermodesulforhabdus norvegica]|uniref:ParB/Sulfiredoxin domain-containing protein n=1 Tax=Thermodesulforhabdus norvegica TaxID=39841 RepID=A0A1I4TC05_9BACT|nr:hypothetical protein [Thermodesulforhabdus norvegica]SFM74249.1 hypothetical protein SAMN05660836_01337 [Thermodesulforhabdus norvegica]
MSLAFEFCWLSPEEIAKSELFHFSAHRAEAVIDFIERTGVLLCPLWVRRQGTQYLLVDGYCRILWAERRNGRVPCIVFPESIPERELLSWKVFELLSRRDPDIIEKARIVKALSYFYPPDEIKERFFPLLKIPRKPRMFKTMLLIAGLDQDEVAEVVAGRVSEKVLFRIVWWDERSRRACVELLSILKCSVSLQRELVELIDDIARLDNTSRAEVIEQEEVRRVIHDSGLTPRNKTEFLRSFLRRRLYPALDRRERSFRKILKELSLPPDITLKPPEFFEGDEWNLNVSFADVEELRNRLEKLLRKETISGLKKILEDSDE